MKRYLPGFLCVFLISFTTQAQWVKTGDLYGGKINCFSIYGTTLFAGTVNGIYTSTNNGGSWLASSSGISSNSNINAIAKIGPNIVLATSTGIYLSNSNGASWTVPTTTIPDTVEIVSLAVIGTNIFAASNTYGVYQSTTNGVSWTLAANTGLRYSIGITSLAVSASNLYAVSDSAVYVSTDNASTWTLKSSGIAANAGIITLAPNGGMLFTGAQIGIYQASEPITTWATANSGLPANTAVIAFTSNAANTVLFAATSAGLYLSKDTGKTWRDTILGLPANAAIQAFAWLNPTTLFAASPTGFYSSNNSGKNWTFLGCSGISQIEVNALAFNSGASNLFAATSGSGVYASTTNGTSWSVKNSGLNLLADFNSFANSGTKVFAASTQSIYQTSDNGTTWTPSSAAIPTSSEIRKLASSGSSLFAATSFNRVYLGTNNGFTWTSANTGLAANTKPTCITADGTTVYLGTDTDGVYKTDAAVINWTNLNSGLPVKAKIQALAANGSSLYASTTTGFYKSSNSGTSWAISANGLPVGAYFSSIVISGTSVVVGGENGVYMSNNNGQNWLNISSGLPSGVDWFRSIVINGDNLFVGTDKQGVWKRTLSELICTFFPPAILTSATAATVCSGTPLSIALSCVQPATFNWLAADNASISGESTSNQTGGTITNTLINTSLAPQVVEYTVTPAVTGSSCAAIPQQVLVTVNPKPQISLTTDTLAICTKSRINIPITCNLPSTYSWVAASNSNVNGENLVPSSTASISDSLSNTSSLAQLVIYSITATANSSSCVGDAFTKTVQVNPLPSITAVPSATAICLGQSLTLSGQGGQSYLWTNNVLDQNPFFPTATASYTVVGTDANGCKNSATATVIVNSIPHLTNAISKSICTGATVALNLTSDLASNFQWIATDNVSVSGENTSIQSSSSLSDVLINNSSLPQTVLYSVTPISNTGSCSGTVQTISILVNPKPVMTSLDSITICDGTSLSISLTSTLASNYTWIASDNLNTSGESTSLQNTNTITNTIALTGNSAQNLNYTVIPTSLNSNCVGNAQTLVVTVNPKPNVTSAASLTICSGSPINLTLTSDFPADFLWVANDNPNTAGESTSLQTSNFIFNSISNSSSQAQHVSFSVTPIAKSGNCVGNTQNLDVLVNPQPTMTSASTLSICSGALVGLNFTSNTPATYTWYAVDNTSTAGETTANMSSNSIGDQIFNATANVQYVNYFVTPTSQIGSCVGNTQNIAIAINAAPMITSLDSVNICTGSSLALSITSNLPSAYTWIAANNPNVTGETIFLQTSNTIFNTLTNLTNLVQTVNYTITPTAISGTCAGIPQNLRIVVSPYPNITSASSAVICSGDTFKLTLTANIPSAFTWHAFNNPNTVGESIQNQNTAFIQDVLVNSTANLQTVNYSISPASIAGACTGNTQFLQVSVRPLPSISVNALPSSTICIGNSVSLNASGASSYSWTGNVQNGVSFTPASIGTFNYSVIGTALNGCNNTASKLITVTALPDTGVSLSADGNTISSNESGAVYQWQRCNPISNISGAVGQSFTISSNGNYRVVLRKNNCSDTSACVWVGSLGTPKIIEAPSVEIFPNPGKEYFNLKSSFKMQEVMLADIFGREVFKQVVNSSEQITLNLSKHNLAPGIYTLHCKGKGQEAKRKLILE